MKFKDLTIGTVFEFASMKEWYSLGRKRGPWRKTSVRKYEHTEDGMKCKVGTINTEVIPIRG